VTSHSNGAAVALFFRFFLYELYTAPAVRRTEETLECERDDGWRLTKDYLVMHRALFAGLPDGAGSAGECFRRRLWDAAPLTRSSYRHRRVDDCFGSEGDDDEYIYTRERQNKRTHKIH
jgi:hypothetical protein